MREKKKWSQLYAVIKWTVKLCYPKIKDYPSNIPKESTYEKADS